MSVGESVLKKIITSSVANDKATVLVLNAVSVILRIHIVSVICWFFTIGSTIFYIRILNVALHCTVSILFTLYTNIFYNVMNTFYAQFYEITKFFLNNYSPQKFRKWKLLLVLSTSVYFIILLQFIEINNETIKITIIEYLISYTIVDQLEQRNIQKLIKSWSNKPKKVVYGEINVIENFGTLIPEQIPETEITKQMTFIIENYSNLN